VLSAPCENSNVYFNILFCGYFPTQKSTCGLLAEEEETEDEKNLDVPTLPIIEPVPAPQSVGEEAAAMKSPSQSILSNFSYTNLKTEIKNLSTKRSSLLLSQQTPPLNISAPLTESEMLEQQTLEEAKTSVAHSSSDDESKSSFQSHIKKETGSSKDNNQHQQENTEEKTKPFRYSYIVDSALN